MKTAFFLLTLKVLEIDCKAKINFTKVYIFVLSAVGKGCVFIFVCKYYDLKINGLSIFLKLTV